MVISRERAALVAGEVLQGTSETKAHDPAGAGGK